MKQGKSLQRKTPLRSTKPTNRGTATLKRGKPLQGDKASFQTGGGTLRSEVGIKSASPPLKRPPPSLTTKRKHEQRPRRKPLTNKPPRVTPEERRTRKVVEVRSDGFCEKCGTPGATDKAHRVSRGVGGAWAPTNILDLCRDCHSYNHANPALAYRGGWHLRSHSAPDESRVWFHNEGTFGWAHLHDDGTFTWAEKVESST